MDIKDEGSGKGMVLINVCEEILSAISQATMKEWACTSSMLLGKLMSWAKIVDSAWILTMLRNIKYAVLSGRRNWKTLHRIYECVLSSLSAPISLADWVVFSETWSYGSPPRPSRYNLVTMFPDCRLSLLDSRINSLCQTLAEATGNDPYLVVCWWEWFNVRWNRNWEYDWANELEWGGRICMFPALSFSSELFHWQLQTNFRMERKRWIGQSTRNWRGPGRQPEIWRMLA